MTRGEYAGSLASKGLTAQDISVICRLSIEDARLLTGRRDDFTYRQPIKAVAIPALYGPPAPSRHQRVLATIESTAQRHGITLKDIMGHDRARRFAWPRQEAMYMVRQKYGLSYPRIGQIMGNRDHTTILHGVRRHKERVNAR